MKARIVIVASAFFAATIAQAESAVIINQTGSPLKIDDYTTAYKTRSSYSSEGILHSVRITNTGAQDVTAYQIKFISFDAFNEDMGRPLGGVSVETIPPGQSKNGSWNQTAYAAFAFQGYGTGVAYVSKARLADGTVWTANEKYVLGELQKIQSTLTAEIFENKDDK